jgi:hypothetical protein
MRVSSVTLRRMLLATGAAIALFGGAHATLAHHSYAMFDGSKTLTVSGTVAKLAWTNPHVFIWVHVPNPKTPGGYDLYAFENGSTNVLTRNGWSKTTLKAGEAISVDFWPLKDGRPGGHFIKAVHSDGRVTWGVGGPRGAHAGKESANGR